MTQQAQNIQGSIVALVTPMFEDGSVDWKSLEKLVEWHIEQGTNALLQSVQQVSVYAKHV
jgi:4-hydroxy-tetrahydrodipicolinate synthase